MSDQPPLFVSRPSFAPPSPGRRRTRRERSALLDDIDRAMAGSANVARERLVGLLRERRAAFAGKTVALVACSAAKASARCAAKDLYLGALFLLSRRLVEARAWPWAILSARHGLIEPDDIVDPYDQELPTRRRELDAWGARVATSVATTFPGAHLVVLAGARYRSFLAHKPFDATCPLIGMGIGEQRVWLAAQLATRS